MELNMCTVYYCIRSNIMVLNTSTFTSTSLNYKKIKINTNLKHIRAHWTAAVSPETLMGFVCYSLSGRKKQISVFVQRHDGSQTLGEFTHRSR